MADRDRDVLAAACASFTAALFLPCIAFPLLNWDDGVNVVQNGNLGFSAAALKWQFTGSLLGHWHPLTWLSLSADRALWGGAAAGFHLTNILLHALNAALFLILARRLLLSVSARAEQAQWGALVAALFWSLHPLRVESVAWVTERRDVLSCAFMLAASLAYVRAADAGDGKDGRRLRLWALAFGAAAMASKVFAVVLPALFLLLDARLRARPRWAEKLPWLIPIGVTLAFNLPAQAQSGAAVSWSDFGLVSRLAQAVYGLAFYVGKTVAPARLGPLYERSLVLEPIPFIVSGLFVAAAVFVLWRLRNRFPGVAQAALAYALLALPALGLFKSGRMSAADRYAYLPGLPLSLLAGAAFLRVPSKNAARLAAAAVLFACVRLTTLQLPVWSSDVALWQRACAVSPLSFFARLKLASAEEAAGDPESAAADRAEAARLHTEVFTRAAAVYESRGDGQAAQSARDRAAKGISFLVP